MKKTLQTWTVAIFILFLFPVILQFIPQETTISTKKFARENASIVYAANVIEKEVEKSEQQKRVLLYFTHSHEAYKPMTQAADGKVTVSHHSENVMKIGEKLSKQLTVHGVEASILEIDNLKQMQEKRIPYYRAYKEIRPYVKSKLEEDSFDLVIDIHRDSVGPDKTTLVHQGEKYAKVAFVIGMEHPHHKKNLANATALMKKMEELVPGITRGLIKKGGPGVDGKYNQDLDTSVLLMELGGVGNSEAELNRTVAIIAEAIAAMSIDKSEKTPD